MTRKQTGELISRRADYATRILLDVASHGSRVTTAAVARRQLIPVSLVRSLTRRLVVGELLASQRGGQGGIWLGRSGETISLLEVIELIDGPLSLNRCLIGPGTCPLDRSCPVHRVWRDLQDDLRERLRQVMVADLVTQGQAIRGARRTARGR